MYNLQVVQGKDIKGDQYEGSPLQDTRDLAWYNITEGSEIIYERIIMPKFLHIARNFVTKTAIKEYLNFRFGDIYNSVKRIYSYYSETHRQEEQKKRYSNRCSVTNKISDHSNTFLQTSNSNNGSHSQNVQNRSEYSADKTSNQNRSNDDHINNESSRVNNDSLTIIQNSNSNYSRQNQYVQNRSEYSADNKNYCSNYGRSNSKPKICFHFRDHGWCPHGVKCYYYH